MAMNRENKRCKQCDFVDCDLEMVGGCTCSFHARCLPVDLLANHQRAAATEVNTNKDTRISCPYCGSINKGMYLYPLSLQDLSSAATFNQQSLGGGNHYNNRQEKTAMSSIHNGRVRKRGQGYHNNDMEMGGSGGVSMSTSMPIDENSTANIAAMGNHNPTKQPLQQHEDHSVEYIHSGAVPYLIFSKSNISIASDFSKSFVKGGGTGKNSDRTPSKTNMSNSSATAGPTYSPSSESQTPNSAPDNDKLHFRTGRWTSAETAYVDLLIQLFDTRQLSSCLPGGIKLNEFLRDLVLCKSSRLTKKYKNAKLSARSFRALIHEHPAPAPVSTDPARENQYVMLSKSQHQFLVSIRSNVTRLILKFNMSKMWRIHLSNLCLQIGYQGLYTTDWVKSLDEMEKKVNAEEMNVRRVRRKRMEAALRHDIGGNENLNVISNTVGDCNTESVSHTGQSTTTLGNPNHNVISVPTSISTKNELKTTADTVKAIVKRNRSNSGIYFGNVRPPNTNTNTQQTNFKRTSTIIKTDNKDDRSTVTSSELVAKVSNASIASSANDHVDITTITANYEAEAIPVLPLPRDFVPVQQIYQPNQLKQQVALAQVSPTTGPYSESNCSQKDGGDDDFSIGFLDLDDFVGNPYPYLNDKSDDDDSCFQMKSPFTSKIMSFIQSEDLPFQYIDVWVPCTESNDNSVCFSSCFDSNGASNKPTRLIHAGDAKRCDLEQVRVMQLNEFYVYSKNYSFDSGAGMPGRVFASSSWSWLEGIQNASPEQFERIGGAKMCGIRTAVGIPVHSSKIGTIIVGLYSFSDLKEDPEVANKLYAEFMDYDPQPKWTLYIDMNSQVTDPIPVSTSVPTLTVSANESFDIGSTCAQSVASQTSDLTSVVSQVKREEGLSAYEACMIANILAEHIPVEGYNASVPLSSFISLRLLLLRYPNGCSEDEKKLLFILKMSYDGYTRVNKSKREIAELLVKDWIHLNGSEATGAEGTGTGTSVVSSPWGTPMTFVDYATSTTLLGAGHLANQASATATSTDSSSRFPLIQPHLPSTTTSTFFLPPQATSANNTLTMASSANGSNSPSITSMYSNGNASEVGDASSKRYLGV